MSMRIVTPIEAAFAMQLSDNSMMMAKKQQGRRMRRDRGGEQFQVMLDAEMQKPEGNGDGDNVRDKHRSVERISDDIGTAGRNDAARYWGRLQESPKV